tara:strand:+ start:93 stop:290 length:198 start_codon:yes stop_codon:yes gene_type:complete
MALDRCPRNNDGSFQISRAQIDSRIVDTFIKQMYPIYSFIIHHTERPAEMQAAFIDMMINKMLQK